MDQPEVTTVPPVHHAGPDTAEREIAGGEAEHVGVDSLIMGEFQRIMTDMAAKNTRVVVAAPLRQLVDAVMRIIPDLPRIPDYDDVSSRKREWSEGTEYSPFELPESTPKTLGVNVEGAAVVVRANLGTVDDDVRLDPDSAEDFFLAGLAAARRAKIARAEAELAREQSRGALIVPEGFSRR